MACPFCDVDELCVEHTRQTLALVETLKGENARLKAEALVSREISPAHAATLRVTETMRQELSKALKVVEAARALLDKAFEAIKLWVDEGTLHELPDCPEDDTCECRVAAQINAFAKEYDEVKHGA